LTDALVCHLCAHWLFERFTAKRELLIVDDGGNFFKLVRSVYALRTFETKAFNT